MAIVDYSFAPATTEATASYLATLIEDFLVRVLATIPKSPLDTQGTLPHSYSILYAKVHTTVMI